MKLILVRHTTTSWNREQRKQGHMDIELDEGGRKEAHDLAELLSVFDVKNIISSDLKRAQETARIISIKLNAPVSLDQRLRECSFGALEGMTLNEIRARYGNVAMEDRDYANPFDFREFGGESYQEVLDRHADVLREYRARFQNDTVLFVGHGEGLNILLYSLGQTPNLVRGEYRVLEV